MRKTSAPTYVMSERRLWKNLDVASFRSDLCSSSLCTANLTAKTLDADAMAAQYNQVMTAILDDMVPAEIEFGAFSPQNITSGGNNFQ